MLSIVCPCGDTVFLTVADDGRVNPPRPRRVKCPLCDCRFSRGPGSPCGVILHCHGDTYRIWLDRTLEHPLGRVRELRRRNGSWRTVHTRFSALSFGDWSPAGDWMEWLAYPDRPMPSLEWTPMEVSA